MKMKMSGLMSRKSRRKCAAQQRRSRSLRFEPLESRHLLAAGLQNPGNPLDVNGDLAISPVDALHVINYLNRQSQAGQGEVPTSGRYYDVNGDGQVSPLDALLVINALNRRQPEIVFNLTHDSQSAPGQEPESTTFEVVGRINFAPEDPELFIGVGTDAPVRWIDASDRVDRTSGEFSFDSAAMRSWLGTDLGQDEMQLWLGSSDQGIHTQSMPIDFPNRPPEIQPLEDRTLRVGEGFVEQPLVVSDPDGDELVLAALASVVNPLAEIREAYGLRFGGDYFFDMTGLEEKWLFGDAGSSFLLLPNGDLVQWADSYADTATPETLIARLDSRVYDDPSLLWDAEPEFVAPATVFIEEQSLIVQPHPGVVGDIVVRVAAHDGIETSVASFVVHIEVDEETHDLPHLSHAQLLEQAKSLTHEEIPAFTVAVNEQLDSFSGFAAAQLTDLLRQLNHLYAETELRLAASAEWEAEEKRLRQLEIDRTERIHDELVILQAEYHAAWEAIRDRLDDAAATDESGPPVFVNGTDLGDIDVRRGEVVELDLRAIHPSHQPFYYFPDHFDYDPEIYGHLAINPQSGIFTWYTPSNASGTYTFTVVAEVRGNNTAEVTFNINITSNDPVIESLVVSPAAITNQGTDPIVLTAQGVTHPSGRVDRVYFYQDVNGNGVFEKGIDRFLGRDERGDDGWSWTGLPFPVEDGATEVTFFAQAVYFTFSSANYSEPVAVTAEVLQTPDLDVDLVAAIDAEPRTVSEHDGSAVHPDPDHFAVFDGDRAVYAYGGDFSEPGIYLQWRTDADVVGVGPDDGAATRMVDFPVERFVVRADEMGNAVVVYSTSPHFGEAGVWMVRVDRTTRAVSEPVALASGPVHDGEQEYVFTFAMNESGQGVVAWKGYYVAPAVHIQTFTEGGQTLGQVVTIEENGGFHDGGRWYSSDVSPAGNYIVAWSNHSSQTFTATGRTDLLDPPLVAHSSFPLPHFAAINDTGWSVLAQTHHAQILDPQGNLAGSEFETTRDTSGFWFHRAIGVSFLDEQTLSFLWSQRTDSPASTNILQRRFELDVQADLSLQALHVADEQALRSGETVDVGFAVGNLGLSESRPVDVTFHLSHEDRIVSASRLLGTAVAGSVAAGGVGEFPAQIVLPESADPFWLAGSTSLHLIASIPASGNQLSITLPFVTTDPVDGPGGDDDGSDPSDPGEPGNGAPDEDIRPKYIRPNVALDQIPTSSLNTAVDLMELIGRQLVSALRSLRAEAPFGLASTLQSMANDVELRLDTFYLERYTLTEARDEALAVAESEKFAAISSALGQYESQLAAETARRDALIAANEAQILREQQKANEIREARERELQSEIHAKRTEIVLAELAVAQYEQTDEGFGFALGGFLGQLKDRVVEGGSNLAKCVANPSQCAKDVWDELERQAERRLRELRDTRDRVVKELTPVIAFLENQLSNAASHAQAAFDQAVRPFRQGIQQAQAAFHHVSSTLRTTRDRLIDEAETRFNQALADIPRDFAAGIELVRSNAAPALAAAGGQIDVAVQSLTSPGGLLEAAYQSLDAVATHNPFGSANQILEGTSVLVDIATGAVNGIGETLQPALAELENAGGQFSQWARETGGQISDWAQETGGKVVDWVKENVADLLNQEIIVYSVCSPLDVSLNLFNGSVYAQAEIGPGISYDTPRLQRLLAGQMALPSIDPIRAASIFYGVELNESSDYDRVRDGQYAAAGPQNVYFASRRFVSYMGVETVAGIAAQSILTGGAGAQDAIAGLAEQVRLELNDILAWMQLRGQSDLDSVAAGILQSIFTQSNYATPHFELRWVPVTYRYELDEIPFFGRAIQMLGGGSVDLSNLVGGRSLGVDLPHAAFAIIWKSPSTEDPLDPQVIEAQLQGHLASFDERQFTGDSLQADLVDRALAELEQAGVPGELLQFGAALRAGTLQSGDFEAQLAQRLRERLALDEQQLADAFSSGNVIVDLSSMPAGNRLESLLGSVAFGNQGHARVDRMELDLSSFSLSVSATLCHRHSWGSISSIVSGVASAF